LSIVSPTTLPDGQARELKVAAVYESEERRNKKGEIEIHAVDIDYLVATDPETVARAAYLEAVKRGAEVAEEIIVLGDGASWIWNRITPMFPRSKVTEVLDFYHASEYLWNAGPTVWAQGTPEAQRWGEEQCHALKHDGPGPVLEALRALAPATDSPPEPLAKAITYFENQAPRMEYPSYTQRRLQIGNGSAESAVKQVVGSRLNQAGMRWNPQHAEAVAHGRAAILSDRWDAFWSDFRSPARQYQRKKAPLAA
jgi:hypothetical protein